MSFVAVSQVVVVNKKLGVERIAFSLLFCWVCNLEFAVLGREKKMSDVCISGMEVRQLDSQKGLHARGSDYIKLVAR